MTPLDNLRRLVAGWRGEWRVDAHEGITLSRDDEEWPIDDMDDDVMIALVATLNAIRPAVDGATSEIERLTAELAAARQVADARREWLGTGDAAKSPPRTDTAAIAADMLACAEAWAPGAMLMGNVRADEIAAVCRELAAARAVPPDVEAAIIGMVDATIAAHDSEPFATDDPSPTMDAAANTLRTAITRAISDATGAARNNALRTVYGASPYESLGQAVVRATASKPATVGGLLATAPRRYLCENQACRVVSVTCPHCGETIGPIGVA